MLVVAEWVQFRPSSSVSFVSLSRLLCAFAIRINWIGALPNFHNFRQTNAAKRNEWISAHTPHSSAGEFYIFICFVNLCMNVNTAYILSCVVVAHTTRFRRKEYYFFFFLFVRNHCRCARWWWWWWCWNWAFFGCRRQALRVCAYLTNENKREMKLSDINEDIRIRCGKMGTDSRTREKHICFESNRIAWPDAYHHRNEVRSNEWERTGRIQQFYLFLPFRRFTDIIFLSSCSQLRILRPTHRIPMHRHQKYTFAVIVYIQNEWRWMRSAVTLRQQPWQWQR